MGLLEDKVVLITGGESGIGLATAKLFVNEGAKVQLLGIDSDKLDAAVKELGEDRASSVVADVTDEAAVKTAIDAGADRFGNYDHLFSNAGISGAVSKIVDYPADLFARVLAVHMQGAFHVLKYGIPRMNDGGSITITSSVVGLVGFGDLSAYVAAKHGQVGLMRSAAKELAPRKIRVNTLHPGPTSTPFQDDIEMRATGDDQQTAARVFDEMIPLGRHTSTDEIAQAVLYLASDAAAMITSHTLAIDGGMSG